MRKTFALALAACLILGTASAFAQESEGGSEQGGDWTSDSDHQVAPTPLWQQNTMAPRAQAQPPAVPAQQAGTISISRGPHSTKVN